MFKREKELLQRQLNTEKRVIKDLAKQYQAALKQIDEKIIILQSDELTQSRIYHLQYQKALKGQVQAILEKLKGDVYTTIQQFLHDSYTDAFIGTMYNLHGQGMPLIIPIDQKQAVKAILTDSEINEGLYEALGVDAQKLKKTISSEITRGIASSLTYAEIARNISNASKAPLSRAKLITRTESHRIQQEAAYDSSVEAKEHKADVVNQWCAVLDGRTRDNHRKLDGQIREVGEAFEIDGKKAKYPGGFGDPSEDCNCRCVLLTRAVAALDEEELKTLQERADFWGLDKSKDFEEFKEKYLNAAKSAEITGKTLKKQGESGTIKLGNTEVRKWYLNSVSHIPDSIDQSLPMIEKALLAYEARNRIRTEARNMMADKATRMQLDQNSPNKTFEELVKSKMERKGMTREEAIEDVYNTATKTNANVNKELGLEDE